MKIEIIAHWLQMGPDIFVALKAPVILYHFFLITQIIYYSNNIIVSL